MGYAHLFRNEFPIIFKVLTVTNKYYGQEYRFVIFLYICIVFFKKNVPIKTDVFF